MSAANNIFSYIGWTFLPNLTTGWIQYIYYGITIRAGDPKPQPGSPRYIKHRRRIHTAVIAVYLLYTIFEADYWLRQAGDFYRDLGVPIGVDEKTVKSKFRRLAAIHHPDKSTDDTATAEAHFVRLKTAQDTLSDPVKRWAYERFGPDMLKWQHCSTYRDYLLAGLQGIVPLYGGSIIVMIALGVTGYLQWGRFWRYLIFTALFILEYHTITRPYEPPLLAKLIDPLLSLTPHPPLLPFQMLTLAHKTAFTLFIALSQLGPIFAPPQTTTTSSTLDMQQLTRLEQTAKALDIEASMLLGLDMAPFVDDEVSARELRGKVKDWLVNNTIRADPEVRDAMGRAMGRRRVGAPPGTKPGFDTRAHLAPPLQLRVFSAPEFSAWSTSTRKLVDMRLQLTVQRHALPPVQLLWTAGVLRPPYAAAGANCTISQFLEQVNDIIPLESEDWGLEDYAVEVRGFECLHFAELQQVLKEDDEVCIRPLQTLDLRFRKVSGRHQISADGKHLIDGVAFGRPFLRRAQRPAVRIPARKRRRITYDEDDEDAGEGVNDHQLILQADFDDGDASDDHSDDENNEDFSAMEDESLAQELEDLQNDLQVDVLGNLEDGERTLDLDGIEEASGRNVRSQRCRKTGLGLQGSALLELLDDNGRPYPGEYSNPLLDLYDQDEPVQEPSDDMSSKRTKSKRLRETSLKDQKAAKGPRTSSRTANKYASSGSSKAVRFDAVKTMTPATVRLEEDIEVFDAEGSKSQNSTGRLIDESDKENAEPGDDESDSDESPFIESDTSSAMSTSSDSDSEDTSSSGSSSSSISDSEDENPSSSSKKKTARSASSNSTSSSSASNSESEHEKLSRKTAHRDLEKGLTTRESESKMPAPGQGMNQTRKRNQRRRNNKRRAHLVNKGILPPNATLADFHRVDAEYRNAGIKKQGKQEKVVQKPAPETIDSAAAFEAKQKALLASINAGGIDVDTDLDGEDSEAPAATESVEDRGIEEPVDNTPTADAQVEVQNSQPSRTNDVSFGHKSTLRKPTDTSEVATVAEDSICPSSSKRRAKLDLESSRRLVFGSLGLRTPKTKEDESNLREKLKSNVGSTKDVQSSGEYVADSIGEVQSWKEKVILEAVECCHEGVELSTPSFPFIQRWDPQQHIGYGRGGGRGKTRGKKRKRKSKQYYEDWEEQDAMDDESQHQAPYYLEDEQDSETRSVKPRLDSQSQQALDDEIDEDAVNEQLMRESKAISASAPTEPKATEDLPILPKDISSCSDLHQESCTPGTVIAFKQLDMSAETNWQPKISEYKTAIIDQRMDEGALRITLAKRDQPEKEELYDDVTGERVYGKFEMPGYEDTEGDDGNGIVELSFADLIQPKLIQAVESQQDNVQLQQLGEQEASPESASEIVMVGETEDLYPSLDKLVSSKSSELTHESKAEKVSGQVRKEIQDLITDAGWRSSVGSDVLKQGPQLELKPSENTSEGAEAYNNDNDNDATGYASPKFTGFSSSPPANRPVPPHDEPGMDWVGIETDESMLPQTVAETIAATSPHSEQLTSDKVNEDLRINGSEDKDITWDDSPSKSVLVEYNHKSVSMQVSSLRSSPKLVFQESQSRGGLSQRKISPKPNSSFDGADSDNGFPTLENVLASTRSSFESLVPEDEDSTFAAKSSFESMPSADEDQKRQRRSKSAAKRSIREQSKALPEFCAFKEEDDEEFTPRLSQVPLGSQIVDLTMSSDPVYLPGSDDEKSSYRMPNGPGWVRKTRATSKTLSPPKEASFRSRTRSSV